MSNLLTALARMQPLNTTATIGECGVIPAVAVEGLDYCPYIDPNPVDSINGEGHNYFRSSNPYKLESWAAFGEAYYNINPDQIGSASCRERVCKSVEISVVDGTFKKKINIINSTTQNP